MSGVMAEPSRDEGKRNTQYGKRNTAIRIHNAQFLHGLVYTENRRKVKSPESDGSNRQERQEKELQINTDERRRLRPASGASIASNRLGYVTRSADFDFSRRALRD